MTLMFTRPYPTKTTEQHSWSSDMRCSHIIALRKWSPTFILNLSKQAFVFFL